MLPMCAWLTEATESSRIAMRFIEREVLHENLDTEVNWAF